MEYFEDAYCGLYCGACEILRAYHRHENHGVECSWKDLPDAYHGFPNEAEIRCRGCRSDEVFAGCKGCKLRTCARSKGVEYCFECKEYPCQITQELKDLTQQVMERMPHVKGIIRNLDRISRIGKEAWLAEQRQEYSCPVCGKATGWYQQLCSECSFMSKRIT